MASLTMTIPTMGAAVVRGHRRRSLIVASAGEPANPANADRAYADGRRRAMIAAGGAAAATALAAVSRPARAFDDDDLPPPVRELRPDDPSVQEVAGFVIAEHNRQSGRALTLDKVLLTLRWPTPEGYNYFMLLYASEEGRSQSVQYGADVYRSAVADDCLQLISFFVSREPDQN